MDYMFYRFPPLTRTSAWDTSGVKAMDFMFAYTSAFDQDIGAWTPLGSQGWTTVLLRPAFDQDIGVGHLRRHVDGGGTKPFLQPGHR